MTMGRAITELIYSDLRQMGISARNIAQHAADLAVVAGGDLGFCTGFFQWIASFSAVLLFGLDVTNELTSLLIPYIFLSLPSAIFSFLRGELGKWIAFAVLLRFLFLRRVPDWLEMRGSVALLLLVIVTPNMFGDNLKDSVEGVFICLVIDCYLLQGYIRPRGLMYSFTEPCGVHKAICIILLFVYPVWYIVARTNLPYEPLEQQPA